MADVIITKQELIDAQKDAKTLEDVINGVANIQVLSRLGRTFWTLATLNSKINSVETAATQGLININNDVASVEAARVVAESQMNAKVASVEQIFDDKLSEWDSEAQTEINEWRSAISLITQEGGVPALAVSDASGKTQQEINDRTVHIEDYGAVSGGIIDCTAAFNLAKVDAKSRGVPIAARDDAEYLINGTCYFDCDLSGGVYLLGDGADMQLKVESDDVYNIRATFKNVSGIDTKQALICISSDGVNRRGDVRIDCKFYDFLQGVYGKVLRRFHVLPTSYAYSRNTDLERFVEAHFACNTTDIYIAQGESDGSVLGYSSGSGVKYEVYSVKTTNSTDHGVYSSSPSEKLTTIFRDCTIKDAGGNGLKCYSNGDLYISNPIIENIGKIGLLTVANRAFVKGGVGKNIREAAIYNTGKTAGAGVNTFELLSVDGFHADDLQDSFVRIYGPDYLGKIDIRNCTGDCARSALYIHPTTNVGEVYIHDSPILSKSTDEAWLSCLNTTTPISKFEVYGKIRSLTTSQSIIDVASTNLIIDCQFDFNSALRLVRNRATTGISRLWDLTVLNGTTTGGVYLLANTANTERSIPIVGGGVISVSYGPSAPVSGSYSRGSVVYNSAPSLNSPQGWICTVAGSPGTWIAFGAVSEPQSRAVSITTSALSSAINGINTVNKFLGKEVYNTTNSKFMKATGSSATDTWVASDGDSTITPS